MVAPRNGEGRHAGLGDDRLDRDGLRCRAGAEIKIDLLVEKRPPRAQHGLLLGRLRVAGRHVDMHAADPAARVDHRHGGLRAFDQIFADIGPRTCQGQDDADLEVVGARRNKRQSGHRNSGEHLRCFSHVISSLCSFIDGMSF